MKCRHCGTTMQLSLALQDIATGIVDFPFDKTPTTVSPSGRAKLIDCLKCPDCGWSVTYAGENNGLDGEHNDGGSRSPAAGDPVRDDRSHRMETPVNQWAKRYKWLATNMERLVKAGKYDVMSLGGIAMIDARIKEEEERVPFEYLTGEELEDLIDLLECNGDPDWKLVADKLKRMR